MLASAALLFLDFTGTVHAYLGWVARIQLLPALLSGSLAVAAVILLATALVGRVYCSVVCPLGMLQDAIGRMAVAVKGRRGRHKSRFAPELRWLRLAVLVLTVAALAFGAANIAGLLDPYSAFGRIVQGLLAPLWQWANNGLAYLAERAGSYAFYERGVWLRGVSTLAVAAVWLAVVAVLAWRGGRTYCNTLCPVGALLGLLSRKAWWRLKVDESKCRDCGLCERTCKAHCINSITKEIDHSRCVMCMDCVEACSTRALIVTHDGGPKKPATDNPTPDDKGRRRFIAGAGALLGVAAASAAERKVEGGLAPIADKVAPDRRRAILPPGSYSAERFAKHCTACQLCVAACPNDVLRPSGSLSTLMQPVMSYERGYCRPECTRCSEVCPTGAIQKVDAATKTSIKVGHAVWLRQNCLPLTEGVSCGNCARHCPSAAIAMVRSDADNPQSPMIPVVDENRCTGCGACENLCPSRPFSAIYVEGFDGGRQAD